MDKCYKRQLWSEVILNLGKGLAGIHRDIVIITNMLIALPLSWLGIYSSPVTDRLNHDLQVIAITLIRVGIVLLFILVHHLWKGYIKLVRHSIHYALRSWSEK